jgi:hypothetical protein
VVVRWKIEKKNMKNKEKGNERKNIKKIGTHVRLCFF